MILIDGKKVDIPQEKTSSNPWSHWAFSEVKKAFPQAFRKDNPEGIAYKFSDKLNKKGVDQKGLRVVQEPDFKMVSGTANIINPITERYNRNTDGTYEPRDQHFQLNNRGFLRAHDLEKLWFLRFCSPVVLNNKQEQKAHYAYLSFVFPEKDAQDDNDSMLIISKLTAIILDKEETPDARLRQIATASLLDGSGAQSVEILRNHMSKLIASDDKFRARLKEVLKMGENSHIMKLKSFVQSLIDSEVVKRGQGAWVLNDDSLDKEARKLVGLAPGDDEDRRKEKLGEIILQDEDLKSRLEKALEAKMAEA